jgi:hypothetical protein
MALVLGKRPSEILGLKGDPVWLFHVDYTLLADELERSATGEDETADEKAEKMRRWAKRRRMSESK